MAKPKEDHKPLTALRVKELLKPDAAPDKYLDERGLYLVVAGAGSRSWLYCYQFKNQRVELGFGSAHAVSLAEARQKLAQAIALIGQDINPKEVMGKRALRAAEQAAKAEAKTAPTFKECATRFVAIHEPTWKNEVHREQWRSTLRDYAYPVLGDLPVDTITIEHVLQVI